MHPGMWGSWVPTLYRHFDPPHPRGFTCLFICLKAFAHACRRGLWAPRSCGPWLPLPAFDPQSSRGKDTSLHFHSLFISQLSVNLFGAENHLSPCYLD